jgi:hypothetical protein
MSADNIGRCAQCAEHTMREYIDYAVIKGFLFEETYEERAKRESER